MKDSDLADDPGGADDERSCVPPSDASQATEAVGAFIRDRGVPAGKRPLPEWLEPRRLVMQLAQELGFTYAEIVGRSRVKPISRARHIIAWLFHRGMDISLPDTARFLQRGNHTTILSSVRVVDKNIWMQVRAVEVAVAVTTKESE